MKKKGRGLTIKINFSNRWLYTLIAIGIFAIIGVGVYAATYSSSGAGHPYTEISTCGANQILKMNSAGTDWTCADATSGGITTETDPVYQAGPSWAKTNNPVIPGNLNAQRLEFQKVVMYYVSSSTYTSSNCGILCGTVPSGVISSSGECIGAWGYTVSTSRWNSEICGSTYGNELRRCLCAGVIA